MGKYVFSDLGLVSGDQEPLIGPIENRLPQEAEA